MTYDTTFMPSTMVYESGYQPSYQPSYEQRSTNRAPATRDVFLTSNQPGANDATFLREAAIANIAEVALGRLALKNASSTEVRNFAQVVIDEHNQAESFVENIAARVNVDVPDDVDARRDQIEQKLSAMTGTDFDRQFIEVMIRGHREAIAIFETRAAAAPANDVQKFAIETLPKLRHHLKMATDIQAKMGTGNG